MSVEDVRASRGELQERCWEAGRSAAQDAAVLRRRQEREERQYREREEKRRQAQREAKDKAHREAVEAARAAREEQRTQRDAEILQVQQRLSSTRGASSEERRAGPNLGAPRSAVEPRSARPARQGRSALLFASCAGARR